MFIGQRKRQDVSGFFWISGQNPHLPTPKPVLTKGNGICIINCFRLIVIQPWGWRGVRVGKPFLEPGDFCQFSEPNISSLIGVRGEMATRL